MIWYEDLYVGYNLLDKKRKVIRKIKNIFIFLFFMI